MNRFLAWNGAKHMNDKDVFKRLVRYPSRCQKPVRAQSRRSITPFPILFKVAGVVSTLGATILRLPEGHNVRVATAYLVGQGSRTAERFHLDDHTFELFHGKASHFSGHLDTGDPEHRIAFSVPG
jgi:hypothetical protein